MFWLRLDHEVNMNLHFLQHQSIHLLFHTSNIYHFYTVYKLNAHIYIFLFFVFLFLYYISYKKIVHQYLYILHLLIFFLLSCGQKLGILLYIIFFLSFIQIWEYFLLSKKKILNIYLFQHLFHTFLLVLPLKLLLPFPHFYRYLLMIHVSIISH